MTEVRPLSGEALPRVERAHLPGLSKLSRLVADVDTARIAGALAASVGGELEVEAGVVRDSTAGAELSEPLVAVALTGELPSGPVRLLISIDRRSASWLIERALGAEGPPAEVEPGWALSEMEQGVLTFVAARALAELDAPLSVAAVLTTSQVALAALGEAAILVVPFTIHAEKVRGWARLLVSETWVGSLPEPRAPSADRLSDLEIEISLEAARGTLTASELSVLQRTDVVVLEDAKARFDSSQLQGHVSGRVVGGVCRPLRCELSQGAVRVLVQPSDADRGRDVMAETDSSSDGSEDLLEAVGDAPIALSIEVGRVTLTLSELAALRPGEVLATGANLGDRAVLRAGERAIARGELVDVSGELGLRVLEVTLSGDR